MFLRFRFLFLRSTIIREKPASAHVRRLRSRISLARGRRLLQSHNKTHKVHPIVLYMTYGNSGCGRETHTARGEQRTRTRSQRVRTCVGYAVVILSLEVDDCYRVTIKRVLSFYINDLWELGLWSRDSYSTFTSTVCILQGS